MGRAARRATAALVLLGPAIGALACGGDDGPSPAQQAAQDYSLAVERQTDAIYEDGTEAQVLLNRVYDGGPSPTRAASRLDELADAIGKRADGLDELTPPEPAASSGGELADAAETLSLQLATAASRLRAAPRGAFEVRDVVLEQSGLLNAYQLSLSSLSRAVRALAIESAD